MKNALVFEGVFFYSLYIATEIGERNDLQRRGDLRMIGSIFMAATVGLHLGTWHDESKFNDFNPGVYFVHDSGATVGGYYNSERRGTAYAGWTFQTADGRFALLVGAASGYARGKAVPMVVPSIRPLDTVNGSLRVAVLPKPVKQGFGISGVHFSWEKKLE